MAKIPSFKCPRCQMLILVEEMDVHLTSKECDHVLFENTCTQKGWQCLSEQHILGDIQLDEIMLRTHDVQYAVCPIDNDRCTWSDPWILTAVKSFYDTDGFGDMDLAEYLDKMCGQPKE